MNKTVLSCALAALFGFVVAGQGTAQESATQTFRVTAASHMGLSAPLAVQLDHDETDGDQQFPTQQWTVDGNAPYGVSVTFAIEQPFTNLGRPGIQRDARLQLAVAESSGPGAWTVTQSSDHTNLAQSDSDARVQASCNAASRAKMDISVAFAGGEFDTLPDGDYETMVVGTVTAN